MKFSTAFRNGVLKKVLPPESRPISQVSEETGISVQTIRNWLQRLKSGTLPQGEDETSPGGRSAVEKLRLLLESKQVSEENRGTWLREKGLHAEHLPLYEQELVGIVNENSDKARREVKALKKEVQRLSSELRRKDKALAEVTALLVLKKKAEAIWGDGADDSSEPKRDKQP